MLLVASTHRILEKHLFFIVLFMFWYIRTFKRFLQFHIKCLCSSYRIANWFCSKPSLKIRTANTIGIFRNHNFYFFYRSSDWVETLWGFTKFFVKPILKVSAFYLERQKVLFLKNISLSQCQYQNKKALFTD